MMISKSSKSWLEVVEELRENIRTGSFTVGAALPTESQLSQDMAASRGTVRKAILHLIDSGDLMRKPYNRPIVPGVKRASPQARDIYVWVSRLMSDEKALRMVKGVARAISRSQYRLVVREPSRFDGGTISEEERQFLLELMGSDEVAGAIIERDPFAHDDDLFASLSRRKNLVFMDVPPPAGVKADFVGTANVIAARACVEHLVELGHRRIACVIDSDVPEPAHDRIVGYQRAMKHSGLQEFENVIVACELPQTPDESMIPVGQFAPAVRVSNFDKGWAATAVKHILALEPRPTALFCCHDAMAHSLAALLEGQGVQIPEEIAIVGFDWNAQYDRSIPDELTTASQDFEAFGYCAANLLLDRMMENAKPDPKQVLLPAPLVIRSTTVASRSLPPKVAVREEGVRSPVVT